MNHNTLNQAIGESGRAERETLSKSIGELGDSMARGEKGGLKPVGINIHRATGHKGPAIAKEQGGEQYAHPHVKAGSLRSSAPGHGEGRGSPHVHHKR